MPDPGRPVAAVYIPVDDPAIVHTVGFYQADIVALRAAGLDVRICTRLRDLPLRADLYFIWWWTHALPVTILARAVGRPAVITGTFNWGGPRPYPGRPFWQRFAISTAARLASLNLFVSRCEMRDVSNGLGLENSAYFPHSIECVGPGGCVHNEEGPESPALVGLTSGQTVVSMLAWSGRDNLRRKCVFESLEAFESLAMDNPSMVLVIAGNRGSGEKELADRCATSDAAGQIMHVGLLSEVDKHWLLRRTEIFLSPSTYEGFGLAIGEAAAHGCAVISSDVGAVAEVVGNGALYCDGTRPDQIATALRSVLSNEEERQRLVHEGSVATQPFSESRKACDVRDTVLAVLTRPGSGSS